MENNLKTKNIMKTLPKNYSALHMTDHYWQLLKSSDDGDVMYSTGIIAKCRNVSEAISIFSDYLPKYKKISKEIGSVEIDETVLDSNGKQLVSNINVTEKYFLSERFAPQYIMKRHFMLMRILDEFYCESVDEIIADTNDEAIEKAKKLI